MCVEAETGGGAGWCCRFKFDYDTRDVDHAAEVPPIPSACEPLIKRALASLPPGLLPAPPDQLTINEYLP